MGASDQTNTPEAAPPMLRIGLRTLCVVAALMGAALSRPLGAQQTALPAPDTAHATEWGTFELHKFMQPIGAERYAIVRDSAGTVTLTDAFEFTDRGNRVPLATTLREAADGTPRRYAIKGNVSRESTVDADVDVAGSEATVRTDSTTRHLSIAEPAFPIEGYAPLAAQQALIRYWATHGRPDSVATLLGGDVAVTHRGIDTVTQGAQTTALTRYTVAGLIWGIETVWLDDSLRLVAAVTADAEFDHFEGVRAGYEEDLGFFVRRAATDAMAVLAGLAATAAAPATDRAQPLVIVGADVIDATGAPPIHDATIVVRDGRIVAVGARGKVKVPKNATVIDASGKTVLAARGDPGRDDRPRADHASRRGARNRHSREASRPAHRRRTSPGPHRRHSQRLAHRAGRTRLRPCPTLA